AAHPVEADHPGEVAAWGFFENGKTAMRRARRGHGVRSSTARRLREESVAYSCMLFEWDPEKAVENLHKHGVPFEEALSVFLDVLSVTGRGPEHGFGESRFVTFGLSSKGRLLAVSHVDRRKYIRIISARRATRGERKLYEEG